MSWEKMTEYVGKPLQLDRGSDSNGIGDMLKNLMGGTAKGLAGMMNKDNLGLLLEGYGAYNKAGYMDDMADLTKRQQQLAEQDREIGLAEKAAMQGRLDNMYSTFGDADKKKQNSLATMGVVLPTTTV